MDTPLPAATATLEVSARSVAAWNELPRDQRPRLIDCREADELAICRIPGAEWFPLGTFPDVIRKLTADADRGVVVFCHHGMRSLRGASFLRGHGVENAFSMSGGTDAWATDVDPAMTRY